MSNPKISIIIPVFNREQMIKECLNSILNQSSSSWECIVVDDGSTDKTIETVVEYSKQYPQIKFLKRNSDKKGASVCRNIGAKESIGEYLVFLDSDDLISSEFIKTRLKWIKNHKNQDYYVFPSSFFKNSPGDLKKLWNLLNKPKDDLIRFFDGDNPWHTTGVVWRRNSFFKIKGFYEPAQSMQDWEIFVKALIRGLKYTKSPDKVEFLQHYLRKHKSPQISTSKLSEERAINRQETKQFIAKQFSKKHKYKSYAWRSFIGDYYRFTLGLKKAGYEELIFSGILFLVEEKLASKNLSKLLLKSLEFDSKLKNSNNYLKKTIDFILYRFYNLKNLQYPKDRTKGIVYFEKKK